jgi:hypothetical protein
MAYTAPTTRTTGTLITASIWNTDLVDNIAWLYANKLGLSGGTLTGDLLASNSTNITTALPISFSGDANTGIGHPSADTVVVSTGGAERSRWSSVGLAVTGAITTDDTSSSVNVKNSGTSVIIIGNKSAVIGGSYDATPYVYGGTSLELACASATRVTLPSGGGVTIADVAPSTPAAATGYKDSLVSAWARVTFSAGTPSIADDVNVASLTDNGTGNTTVTFATAATNATFCAMACSNKATTGAGVAVPQVYESNTTNVKVVLDAAGVGATDENFSVIVAGGWQ